MNPLDDHDYCSPNKRVPSKLNNQGKTVQEKSTINSNTNDDSYHRTSQQSIASTSLTPPPEISTCQKPNLSNENHINSPLSSSLPSPCSSEQSNTNSRSLVIAQDNLLKFKSNSLASQNTPSVKRKPGRPSLQGNKKNTSLTETSGQDSVVRVKRERQPRQSTSVTDKSQWIVGDDEIDSALSEHVGFSRDTTTEKRQRIPKEMDPAFSQCTSSDYSSSDAESDDSDADDSEDDDEDSEDDPNRLWCICRKPHEGKFMICCDVCKDWFHGVCVGVTKLMGDRIEKQGKEWFCGECQEKLRSGIPRAAIPTKIVKKEKKKKASSASTGRRGRGRPRKSDSSMRESSTRISLRSSRKSTPLDAKNLDSRLKKSLARPDARSESFDDFQDGQKLKELIRERKKAFFYKRQLAAQQNAAKRSELGLAPKQPLTANLSDSLDSLASRTNSPNMNNLPINIKERPKPIVLQINIKKDPITDQTNSSSRIVTTIVRSPKRPRHSDSVNPIANDLFTADPIQINKKPVVKLPVNSSNNPTTTISAAPIMNSRITVEESKTLDSTNGGDLIARKRSNSSSSPQKKSKTSEHTEGSIPKKKRKDSESSTNNGSTNLCGSTFVFQKIKDTLEGRSKQINDLSVSPDKIEKIASEIGIKLNEHFKEGTQKYRVKYASILSNLNDKKNVGLVKSVLNEVISPGKLVNMSHEELASSELAQWRERENKHSIELIKRDAELAAQQVIVKKTHKGEEVIPAPQINEPDDPSVKMDNQETPTTPNKITLKDIPRLDGSKITLTPPVIKPPTIKPMDFDVLPPIHSDRSPNHPGIEDYMDEQQPVTDVNDISSMLSGNTEEQQPWSGTISMPDIAKFSISAKPVCGLANLTRDQISENLSVCGRIPPDQVQKYIHKLKATTKNQILMIQLFPLTDDDKASFDTLFDYLYSRNRYGVIQTNPQLFKDFYIIPIHDKGNIPETLKPTVTGPGIDRKDPNCLIGLLVRIVRRQSSSSSSLALNSASTSTDSNVVYKPTPISQ